MGKILEVHYIYMKMNLGFKDINKKQKTYDVYSDLKYTENNRKLDKIKKFHEAYMNQNTNILSSQDLREVSDKKYVLKRPYENKSYQEIDPNKMFIKLKIMRDKKPILADITDKKIEYVVEECEKRLVNFMKTEDIDNVIYEYLTSLVTDDPLYGTLAVRLRLSNLHQNIPRSFYECCKLQYENVDKITGEPAPLIRREVLKFVRKHAHQIDNIINHEIDYIYFEEPLQLMSLEDKGYLKYSNGKLIDLPQFLFMRVAIELGFHDNDEEIKFSVIKQIYEGLAFKKLMVATPILFNACGVYPQLCSCFLIENLDDSIEGLFSTYYTQGKISQLAGGLSTNYSNTRSEGSYIKGTNGNSSGIVPWIKIMNETMRGVNQGSKRNGAGAPYLAIWHSDIMDFVDLKIDGGDENRRARDVFPGLVLHNYFFEVLEKEGMWHMFSPNEAPPLLNAHGKAFEMWYKKCCEIPGLIRKSVPALEIWHKLLDASFRSSVPYMINIDVTNEHSNQSNLGKISISNLCTEIFEFTSPEEIGMCILSSLVLPTFISSDKVFNHKALGEAVELGVDMLNRTIDYTFIQEFQVIGLKYIFLKKKEIN